jgi:hypothetical protein
MEEEKRFVMACYDGDFSIVAACLRKDPQLLHKFPLKRTVDIEHRAYTLAGDVPGGGARAWFAMFVKHSKTAPQPAFCCVRDTQTLRVLLDKAHVWLGINDICTYIVNKRVDLLRVLADTPWLGFSRRALIHLQTVAQRHDIPHVFPAPEWRSGWDDEENRQSCYALHTTTVSHYSKSNATTLAVVWCTHQLRLMGWADLAQPVIDRLSSVVILELDGEGAILGIPGGPRKPARCGTRFAMILSGLALVAVSLLLLWFRPRDDDDTHPLILWCLISVAFALLATAFVRPRQNQNKCN